MIWNLFDQFETFFCYDCSYNFTWKQFWYHFFFRKLLWRKIINCERDRVWKRLSAKIWQQNWEFLVTWSLARVRVSALFVWNSGPSRVIMWPKILNKENFLKTKRWLFRFENENLILAFEGHAITCEGPQF